MCFYGDEIAVVRFRHARPDRASPVLLAQFVEPVGGEKISGAFSTKTNYSGIQATGSAGNTITINAPSGNTFGFGTVFTFAIPAQNYASGLRFRITATENSNGSGTEKTMVFAKQSAFDVAAGTLYPLNAPAFKESGVTWNNLWAITSSSIVCRWTCANTNNLKKKAWTIHVYSDSGCTTEVASYTIPSGIESIWNSNRSNNDYLSYVVGRLSPGTTYYVVVEDTANGTKSASRSVTTDSFTVVPMPGSISSTGVVFAENFGEVGWGSTAVRTAVGYRPNSASGRSRFNNAYDGSASTFRTSAQEESFISTDYDDAIDNSRLSGWFASNENVFIKPGHVKMGFKGGHGYFITPEFPIAAGKRAKVSVTVNACRYADASTSTYAIAKVHGLSINGTYKHKVDDFDIDDYDIPGYYSTVSIPTINATWSTGTTTEDIYMISGDRLVFGPENGTATGNGQGRVILKSISVEVTEIEDLPAVDFTIYDYSTLSAFLTAASGSSVSGRVVSNISLSSEQASTLASKYPVSGYSGTLYGEGCTITGLTKPLFDDLQGTVSNLTLHSTLNITANQANLGMLANTITGTAEVDSCISEGSVEFNVSSGVTGEHAIGGLVGAAEAGATMSNCTNKATVTNSTANSGDTNELLLGGVLGSFWGSSFEISDCVNEGNVSNTANWKGAISIGGIFGQCGNSKVNSGGSVDTYPLYITSCSNSGSISNSGTCQDQIMVGGIGGQMRHLTIESISNSGTVSNSGAAKNIAVGGLLGYVKQHCKMTVSHNTGDVSNSGNISGTILAVGGLVGTNQEGYLNMTGTSSEYCTNIGTVSDNSSSANGDLCLGGIFGHCGAGIKVQYSRNSGSVQLTSGTRSCAVNLGGIAGWANSSSFNVNNTRNTGNVTVSCTIDNSIWAGGIVGCPHKDRNGDSSAGRYYDLYSNATIDTHSATVSGDNFTGGLFGKFTGSSDVAMYLYRCKVGGIVRGNKTKVGLIGCTNTTTSSFHFQGDGKTYCVVAPGTVRRDNSNNNTINSDSDLSVDVLAGYVGSTSTTLSNISVKSID